MLVRKSLPIQLYETIKSEIILQETPGLKMGDALNEQEVAKRFSCSITPVRECFNMLRQAGLLVSEPYQSSFVVQFSRKDIADFLELRACLETYALERAFAKLDAGDIDKMQKAQDGYRKANLEFNQSGIIKYNWEFHNVIIQRAENQQLQNMIDSLIDRIAMIRAPIAQRRRTSGGGQSVLLPVEEHQKILNAIIDRNYEAAKFAMLAHLNRVESDRLNLPEKDLSRQ